jgi:hypothetical protein
MSVSSHRYDIICSVQSISRNHRYELKYNKGIRGQSKMSSLSSDIGSKALQTEVPTEIKEKVDSLTQVALTHCGKCGISDCEGSKGKVIAVYDKSAVLLECPLETCRNNWLVCLHPTCGGGGKRQKQKKPFTNMQQYKKHKNNTHKASKSGGQSLPLSDEATGLATQAGSDYEDSSNTMVAFLEHEHVVDYEDNSNTMVDYAQHEDTVMA